MLKYTFLGLAAALGASAAGCSSSERSPATEADYDDVAQALSAVVATGQNGGEIGSIHDATQIALGLPATDLDFDASGAVVGTRLGLAYAYTAECSDAAGEKLFACDDTSDSATVNVSWSGDLATPYLSASVSHQGDLELTRIQSGMVKVTGGGDFEYDASFASLFRLVERNYHLGYSVRYVDLKVARRPLRIVGGSAHYTIDARRSGERAAQFRMDGDLTYQWDGSAVLTLDGTHAYAINGESGVVAKY